jgi:hypothetical protein
MFRHIQTMKIAQDDHLPPLEDRAMFVIGHLSPKLFIVMNE